MINLTLSALRALSSLLPVLKRSVNEHGTIPCQAEIDPLACELISMLRQNGEITNADDKSVAGIARALLNEEWSLIA